MILLLTATLLIIFKLFLARKDAMSFLLKEKDYENEYTLKRIKRWHRDGVFIDLLFTGVLCWASNEWFGVAGQSLLIRLCLFDISFNYFAQINYKHLGSTAWADIFFAKIFGVEGAVKKSIFFAILLVIYTIVISIK